MDQKQKKLLIGGVVAAAVVLLFYFALRGDSSSSESNNSILQLEKPKFDVKNLANKMDRDDKVLFAFQGYLKYLDPDYGKRVYLPLVPGAQLLEVISMDGYADNHNVTFHAKHATVTIDFLAYSHRFHVKLISIKTDDGDERKSCDVKDAAIYYEHEDHYECFEPMTWLCVRTEKDKDGRVTTDTVAEFVISAMRAEVNGDPSDHRKGKFTHPVELCAEDKGMVKQMNQFRSKSGPCEAARYLLQPK